MAPRLSFRDRFFSRKVSKAVTSPSAILAAGAAAAVGIVALGPFGVLAGVLGYAARVGLAIPRNSISDIDAFAVNEPWRQFVADALGAQRRFGEAIADMRPGPLKGRLDEIGARLDTGVDEVWNIAQQGNLLAKARKRLDPRDAQWELSQLLPPGQQAPPGSAVEQTARSLQAQIDTAVRMEGVITGTVDRLRLLDARLDEMVTRAVELSVSSGASGDVGGLGSDVDGLVTEMEALRQALEDTGSADPSGAAPTMPESPPTSAP